jgi:hypothetical protein
MQPHSFDLYADVDASTILADTVVEVGRVQEAAVANPVGTVSSVKYAAIAAVTGAASPASRSLILVNKTQSGLVIATLALLGGVNLVAGVEKDITLSVVAGALNLNQGDELEWQSTHVGGTGLVDPGGTVRVTITRTTASQ